MLNPLWIALSMYSRLPVPRVPWDDAGMRYALCWFPVVGLVQGVVMALWVWACGLLGVGKLLFSVLAALVPLAVTGGIHLDGFVDTVDALSSRRDRDEMLRIMKDPHVGAFGAMAVGAYLLTMFGACHEAVWDARMLWCYALGGALVRAVSGLGLLTLPSARAGGLGAMFAGAADRGQVRVALVGWAVLCAAVMVALGGWWMVVGVAVGAAYCAWAAMMKFKGVTGDVAGWFACIGELLMVLGAAVFG